MKISLVILLFFPLTLCAQHSERSPSSGLNCKSCHSCEYPTVTNPCLVDCPREDLITIRHGVSSGPNMIVIDRFRERYGPVVFSHRLHAEMADMGGGCESCHHYNTTGPVLACGSCHEPGSGSMELGMPGLVAAYHRQCMSCHREWQHTVECRSCHALSGDMKMAAKGLGELKAKEHKRISEPTKVVFKTRSDKGSQVTFYHDQHSKLFGMSCTMCHEGQGCVRCHDVKKTVLTETPVSSMDGRTTEEKHKACFSCHENDKCSNCHSDVETKPFNHAVQTGWVIKKYHSNLSCRSCHGSGNRFVRVQSDCGTCHSLEKKGSFRHEVTGVRLDDNHLGFACEDCHSGNRFDKVPDCSTCHDDKSWPSDRPGIPWP